MTAQAAVPTRTSVHPCSKKATLLTTAELLISFAVDNIAPATQVDNHVMSRSPSNVSDDESEQKEEGTTSATSEAQKTTKEQDFHHAKFEQVLLQIQRPVQREKTLMGQSGCCVPPNFQIWWCLWMQRINSASNFWSAM